jgi:hypothetical protein
MYKYQRYIGGLGGALWKHAVRLLAAVFKLTRLIHIVTTDSDQPHFGVTVSMVG